MSCGLLRLALQRLKQQKSTCQAKRAWLGGSSSIRSAPLAGLGNASMPSVGGILALSSGTPFDIRSPTGGLIECGGTFGRRSISPLLRHCCQTVATEAIPILPALHCQVTAGARAFGSLRQLPLRLPHVSEDLSEEQQPPDEDELSESRTMQVDRR
ncbi:hypothetical protein PaG_01888 [Moesziomyces aphidis]|uniref:Uncharacterized protein n=1 Tax=Moesziomyces aphidis TaxID=84754 RepID=W3VPV1_MOEAP|nr:hypothetical protein PaG_01888 [Moesziomyces aphidis]